jgi:O-antigen ligase/tetratricopeptide (TPR) repeat protein
MAIPAVPVLACFLGGATEKWSEGIVLALLGLILLIDPPAFSLGRNLNLILLATVACAATAFLPASWFMQPAWRLVLENDFGISLPGTVSPQPWISLGCVVSFLAGLSWLYYLSSLDLELREVRQQLRFFTAGIVLLAALCIALHFAHSALPFWHNARGFGPFPNRNQTANLFGLTAIVILACGQDDIRHGRKRWIVWLLGLAIVVAAIVLAFSRAGILIVVVGSAFWLGAFVLRRGSAARIALGLSVLLVLLSAMLIFGGQTFDRFHLRSGPGADMTPDLRWAIFHDVLQLIRASPWCGIGLGNFDAVFAVFRDASLTAARTIHPESDWFWLWVEMGWLAIILAIAGIALLIRRVFPLQEGTNQRFRLAALIAAVLFVLHGLVDVSGHRVGTAFSGLFFLGMALRRPMELRASSWLPRLFRLIGLLFLTSGIAWLVATRYEMSLPGGVGVENEMNKASAASQGRSFGEAIERTTRALEWAPLKWQLYFSRALAKVGARRPPADALDDFRRARFLEPNAYEIPYEEGVVWLAREPPLAITAWREALRRAAAQRSGVYDQMLGLASQQSPTVHRGLEEIGMVHHDLALVYLQHAGGADFTTALHRFLEHDPNLQTLSTEEKSRFFSLWGDRGEPEEMARAVEAHPDWLDHAWRAMAKYHSNRNDFQSAFRVVRRFGETPPMPEDAVRSSIDQLRKAFHAAPDNYGVGYRLYREQMREGKIDEALLTARHFTDLPSCPRYFYFLEAEAWAAKENWERAWKAWEKFQAASKQ